LACSAAVPSHGCAVLVIIMSRMNDTTIDFIAQMRAASWMMESVRAASTRCTGRNGSC